MKLFAIACLLVGCGRFGFDSTGAASGDGGGGDGGGSGGGDAPSTGPVGPRYLIEIDANGKTTLAAGANGDVAVAESFQGATTIAGNALVGAAMYESVGLVWLDPTGAPTSHAVLDSTSVCHVRELGGGGGATGGIVTAGYTQAGATTPADGPCALATGHQDGLSLQVAPDAAQAPVGHVVSAGFNTQVWYARGFTDGSVALAGIYGDAPMLGSKKLATTTSDENPFVARVDPATGEPRWVASVVSSNSIESGAIDTSGDDICASGTFSLPTTIFGKALTPVGNADVWIARLDGNGNARFVRGVGSSGVEDPPVTMAATADGGCTAVVGVATDLSIDALTLPAAQGPMVIIRFDASGTATAGVRAPAGTRIARLGERVFSATPGATAIDLASLDALLHPTPVGAITGGASALVRFAAVEPDALTVSFTASAPTMFGALSLVPSTSSVSALATMGAP